MPSDSGMKGELKDILYGRHPIHETLVANQRRVRKIYLAEGVKRQGVLSQILQKAEEARIPVESAPRQELDQVNVQHQGVIAHVDPYPYVTLMDIIEGVKASKEHGLVLILDTIQDPQNLGSLLRTAEATGVHGVILPKRRGVRITPAVTKSSAGASEHLSIVQENLAQAIRELKKNEFWIAGLDMAPDARIIEKVDLSGPLALVVGSEADGLRRLVRESCDYLIRLPMRGKIQSLNAAVAGSIALYTIWQDRGYQGEPKERGSAL
jgi:23S rRNA (guanosine2251-2'-O)-methyltransferase